MRKPVFCICENKDTDQLRGNRETDQRLCFCHLDSTIPLLSKSEISSLHPFSVVQSLFFLNPKFQASIHFLWLPSPVRVWPGRKPRRQVIWRHGSTYIVWIADRNYPSISKMCAQYLGSSLFVYFRNWSTPQTSVCWCWLQLCILGTVLTSCMTSPR